nr:hypothetical protein Itr_chr01CG04950 [Ipomoea trifida]GMC49574.1 hypothetical protein Iba_chr01bCG8870 [Ipomoea batatas]
MRWQRAAASRGALVSTSVCGSGDLDEVDRQRWSRLWSGDGVPTRRSCISKTAAMERRLGVETAAALVVEWRREV